MPKVYFVGCGPGDPDLAAGGARRGYVLRLRPSAHGQLLRPYDARPGRLPEKLSRMLSNLGLKMQKGARNLSSLVWETEKIEKLFSKITVTSVTSVKSNNKSVGCNITDVTDVTVESKSIENLTSAEILE